MESTFLPQAGGYRKLRVFRLSEIICDLTVFFAEKFIRPGSRTRDQMEQAARSGKQNIAEGSAASKTSKETEIKLTNVARSSLEELLLDYEDYLRQHNLPQWDETHRRFCDLRNYLRSESFINDPMRWVRHYDAEEYCNMCITLLNQTIYMLKKLLATQERQFLEQGGIKEQMFRARLKYRSENQSAPGRSDRSDGSDRSDRSDRSDPAREPGL